MANVDNYGIGLGSLYRDTYVLDAQRFYTNHIQYINREYVLHTKPETVWIGSDQIRCSTFQLLTGSCIQTNCWRAFVLLRIALVYLIYCALEFITNI
jgi:hypothetical protein